MAQGLTKLVAVLRLQRIAAMSAALRAWLLALIALEARATHYLVDCVPSYYGATFTSSTFLRSVLTSTFLRSSVLTSRRAPCGMCLKQ